jgi:PAS domain S-box-containing protein
MTVRQIRPKEDVEELISAIRNNNFEQYSDKTWRHLKKDGSPIFVKLQSNPINFRGQNARVVLALDITKEVEAEAKTEKIYKYLERFQEAVSKTSFLGLMDEKGNLSFVNEALLEKTRLNSSTLIGNRWSILFSNIHNNEDFIESWNQIKNRKIWKAQRKFTQKNGSDFWVNCTIIPVLDGEEATSQYLLIANDISNLKEAEKRNREYSIKLHNILEGVTDAIFVLDKNWLLTNTNKEAEKLLEKKGNFLLGKNIWEIFPAEEGFKFYQFFRKAKKRKITVQFEEFYAPKNQWFDISIYPSKDGLAVCFRDVSERKKKEEERKELLEHLVIQNRDLEEFAYITSHSLRSQVANISMLSSAIDHDGLTPLNQEIFEKLFQSSSNLNTVIGDLNTILTIKNKQSILFEQVPLSDIYLNAVSKISSEYSPFKKFIKTDFEKVPKIKTSRTFLETVFFQIISNSIKFRSLDKTPEILIQSNLIDNKYYITIQDNGMGFDLEKNARQILKLYKTFHDGISGKGLGLYLCKILMEELKGTIEIESKAGIGTKVILSLPILKN